MAEPDPWTPLAYAMFAMHQDLPLDHMAPMSNPPHLVAPKHQSPECLAAASSPDASLLDVAPELLAMPPAPVGADVPLSVRPDSDIIGIYAPETAGEYRRPMRPVADQGVERPVEPSVEDEDVHHPRTAVQIGLLRELAELDP